MKFKHPVPSESVSVEAVLSVVEFVGDEEHRWWGIETQGGASVQDQLRL